MGVHKSLVLLAGVAGFEPTHARVKVSCLTAWLHPNIKGKFFVFVVGYTKLLFHTITIHSRMQAYTQILFKNCKQICNMVCQKGFEPLTLALEGRCSIQLSYWHIIGAGDGNRTHVTSLEGWGFTIKLHPHNK